LVGQCVGPLAPSPPTGRPDAHRQESVTSFHMPMLTCGMPVK
jgi:hypothetical protein